MVDGGFIDGSSGGGFREEEHPRDARGEFTGKGGPDSASEGNPADAGTAAVGFGGIPEKTPSPEAQEELSRQGGRRVSAAEQRHAEEHNEAHLAAEMEQQGFHALPIPDGAPEDVRLHEAGKIVGGIELKTLLFGGEGPRGPQLRMKADALERKRDWQVTHAAQMHTVVFDDRKVFNALGEGQHDESQRVIYYRRGCANFEPEQTMVKVRDMAHLAELLRMPDDELPAKGKAPKDWPKVNKLAE